MTLRMILPVILAAGLTCAGAQAQASEVAHASSLKKKRLEALRVKVAAEKAELSRLRGEIAHARVALHAAHRVIAASTKTHSTATAATPAASGNAVAPLTNAKVAEFVMHQAPQSLPALDQVVQELARKAARDEEARVKDELQVKEAKLEVTKPTAARNLRVKALVSLPSTARTAQAVAMKVSRAEESLVKVKDASARAKKRLQIQEAKNFLAAAQDDLKEHDEEAKQFLSAALEAVKDGEPDDEVAKPSAAAAKAPEAAETQQALAVEKVRASLTLRKLKAEKAEVKAKLAALKAKLQKAKNTILKLKEATSRVKEVSHKLVAEPLDPQAVSINLARIHSKARHASLRLAKAKKFASVVHKLEVDKAAEQRAVEKEKQSHKAVMTDMMELQKVESKMVENMHP